MKQEAKFMQNYHAKVYFLHAKTELKQQEVKVYIGFCEITFIFRISRAQKK